MSLFVFLLNNSYGITIMPQFSNQILEVSGGSEFISAVARLLNGQQTNSQPENSFANIIAAHIQRADYQFSDIITDEGNGRISAGIKSLDLLSILCAGEPPDNLFLFDNVIFAGSVNLIKSANPTELTDIVLKNLGMFTIVNGLANVTTVEFKDKCLQMGNDVKVGNFFIDKYKTYILSRAKTLTRSYIKTKI